MTASSFGKLRRFAQALAGLWLAIAPASASAQADRAQEARDLRARIDGLLRKELTECWYPRSLDREGGGFHQDYAPDWSPLPDANRFLVYQGRMTWTAAAFALHSTGRRGEDEYARICPPRGRLPGSR